MSAAAPAITVIALRIGDPIPGCPDYRYAGVLIGLRDGPDQHIAARITPTAKCQWGKYGHAAEDAGDRHDGLANTQAMAAAGNAVAQQLLAEGAHIASQNEAALVAANLHALMPKGWHWTSTQCSPDYAWVQDFEDGNSDVYFKHGEFRAVAVRRFNPSDFGPSEAA